VKATLAEGSLAGRAAAAAPSSTTFRRVSLRRWLVFLVVLDVVAAAIAATSAATLRFGGVPASEAGVSYVGLGLLVPPMWLALLALTGSYERRYLAEGAEQFKRVVTSGLWFLVVISVGSFLFRINLSRVVVGIVVSLAIVLTVTMRYLARMAMHRRLAGGAAINRVLVVGSAEEVGNLSKHMTRASFAGFGVVAVCLTEKGSVSLGPEVTILTDVDLVADDARRLDADTIAIAGTGAFPQRRLRELSWKLEGSGIELMVAPAITDIAGPRIIVRPVDGLPMLHIDEPQFTGFRRALKEAFDRAAALTLIIVMAPFMAVIAVGILVNGSGPVLYKQVRVGRNGKEFRMWKFRTMRPGADAEHEGLAELNEHDGVLFKIRNDPRVTPIGRWLRRHSVDELPQLFNVIAGQMSLVGPRPPLPSEVARFGDDVRRRLLVKPGMTGLWQTKGRADLSWDECVRLDLYYLENWSVAFDFVLLWKTLAVVFHGRGAY
jgi:exopolysaccharide biosynthesis polyprenyl glycosylphosphotransferase